MRSQINRGHSILQRKPVRDQVRQIEPIAIPSKDHLSHQAKESLVRSHGSEKVLAVFNLGKHAIDLDLALPKLDIARPLGSHGLLQGSIHGHQLSMPGHSVLFAQLAD